jgi:RNA polymerase-binding transcription factor DksA
MTDADAERTRLLDTIEGDLAGVTAAMERLDADTYFSCASCAVPLDDDALVALPTLRLCPSCMTMPSSDAGGSHNTEHTSG